MRRLTTLLITYTTGSPSPVLTTTTVELAESPKVNTQQPQSQLVATEDNNTAQANTNNSSTISEIVSEKPFPSTPKTLKRTKTAAQLEEEAAKEQERLRKIKLKYAFIKLFNVFHKFENRVFSYFNNSKVFMCVVC